LTDETRNLIDATALAKMKPSAFLINTARGSIVDEVALEQRLHAGKLAGAALDVLAREPGTPDHPLFRYDNFLCTPHMAWHSDEAMQELKRKAAEEVRRVLHGEPPLYQMNKF
jgi:D-3-phosphoglycerate dehydrogenase